MRMRSETAYNSWRAQRLAQQSSIERRRTPHIYLYVCSL